MPAEVIILIPLFALLVWMMLRPQMLRRRHIQQIQAALEPGTEVILGGGVFGTVKAVNDEKIDLEVAPGVTLKVHRDGVAAVVKPEEPSTESGD